MFFVEKQETYQYFSDERENVPSDMCAQQKPRKSKYAQSDHSLHCLPEETLDPQLSKVRPPCDQNCTDASADLS